MKRFVISLISAAIAHVANGAVFNSGAIVNTVIPDGDFSGVQSTITIAGLPTQITDVNVTLNVGGGFNGDFYAYLYHNGTSAILLNRVGRTSASSIGYPDAGFGMNAFAAAFKFDDQSAQDVHLYRTGSYVLNGNSQLTGTWQPDGRAIDPSSSGAAFDTASRSGLLGLFNGMDPNGAWSLYIADLSSGGEGTLANWGLEITAVPEPGIGCVVLLGAILFVVIRRPRRFHAER